MHACSFVWETLTLLSCRHKLKRTHTPHKRAQWCAQVILCRVSVAHIIYESKNHFFPFTFIRHILLSKTIQQFVWKTTVELWSDCWIDEFGIAASSRLVELEIMHFSEKDQFSGFQRNRLLFAPSQLKCWLSLWTVCFSWRENNTLTISSFCFFPYTSRASRFLCIMRCVCWSSISSTEKRSSH